MGKKTKEKKFDKTIDITYTVDCHKLSRWANYHRADRGRWVQLDKFWLFVESWNNSVCAVALGDSYMHESYGETEEDFCWQGSYFFETKGLTKMDMNWHGTSARSFGEVFEIVSNAKYPELKYYLWGEEGNE